MPPSPQGEGFGWDLPLQDKARGNAIYIKTKMFVDRIGLRGEHGAAGAGAVAMAVDLELFGQLVLLQINIIIGKGRAAVLIRLQAGGNAGEKYLIAAGSRRTGLCRLIERRKALRNMAGGMNVLGCTEALGKQKWFKIMFLHSINKPYSELC